MSRRAVIIGGTGQIGRAVALELFANGWQVTLACRNRRPLPADLAGLGFDLVAVDRDVPGALSSLLSKEADAVIDTVAYTAEHAKQLLEIEANAGTLAVISSCSVYRDDAGRTLDEADGNGFPQLPEPIPETQPTVPPGPETYSTRKAALERHLLDHARRPVTVLRPCAIYGPYTVHPREWWFVKRMLDKRKVIPLAYQGESRFHTSAVANIAALARVAIENPATRILNAADPVAPTVAEIGAMIARCLDYECQFLPVDEDNNKGPVRIGDTPWSVPLPFVLDTSAALALGYKPVTTYENAIGDVCNWLVSRAAFDWREEFPDLAAYPVNHFDYEAEDEFLAKMTHRPHKAMRPRER
jgi:nucleoside-diphosphate-sugar epimerase